MPHRVTVPPQSMQTQSKPLWKRRSFWIPLTIVLCMAIGGMVWRHISIQTTTCSRCGEVAQLALTSQEYEREMSPCVVVRGHWRMYVCARGHETVVPAPFDPLGWFLNLFR